MTKSIIEIKNLSVKLKTSGQPILNTINLNLPEGKITGIVGESGSGKTMTALSIMGILPKEIEISKGQILFSEKTDSIDLLKNNSANIKGKRISMIFQEPMSSLNPSLKCGYQIDEALKAHLKIKKRKRKEMIISLFTKVKLPDPEKAFYAYPHQLSGGQLQRIMIAMALSVNPALLIADEPTTALDVTVQKEVLSLLKELQKEYKLSVMFISHDLRILKEIADVIAVMKKGEIVETGNTEDIFSKPKMPYTQGLLACQPSLKEKPYRLLSVYDFEKGIKTPASEPKPAKILSKNCVLEIKDLNLFYQDSGIAMKSKTQFQALKNINLKLYKGESLGLVGESGCGKTSLGKTILGLIKTKSGNIEYKNINLCEISPGKFRKLRKDIQVVFQDPYSSLNPRLKIKTVLLEARKQHFPEEDKSERQSYIQNLILNTGLDLDSLEKFPHEFSGGQRQRIGIARALATEPEILILDEAVSALDVSVQAQILNLLNDLQEKYNLSYLFISHDLSVVKYMSDRLIIMKDGQIEEEGDPEKIYKNPASDYTRYLIESIPGN